MDGQEEIIVKIYEFSFSGCSCGCTPGGNIRVESYDKQETVKALAHLFFNNKVYGTSPYRKCYYEPKEDLESNVIERADRLDSYSKDIKQIKSEISMLDLGINAQDRAIATLKIEIPEHILESQNQAKENIRFLTEKLTSIVLEGNNYAKIDDTKVKAYETTYDSDLESQESEYYFREPFQVKEYEEI